MNQTIKKTGIPVLILLAGAIVMAGLIMMKTPPEQKEVETPALLVDVVPIEYTDVQFELSTQGTVSPKNQTNLTAFVSGRVAFIAEQFVAGALINKGDVLLRLESDDFMTDVQLAEAEVARATAALQEELARARVAETEWRSINQNQAPELGLRKPQLKRERANVKAAEAQLARAKRNLSRTEIRAPYDGIVVQRNVNIGQTVSATTPLGTVYSTDMAEIRLPLSAADLAFIDFSQQHAHSVMLSVQSAGSVTQWQAQLVRHEGVLDERNRVLYGVAQINDPYRRNQNNNAQPILFGQFVNASILGKTASNVVVLPRQVLRLDKTVLVVTPDNEIAIREVEVVKAGAENVTISHGFEAQDRVIVSAVPNPYPGMPVRVSGEQQQDPSIAQQDVDVSQVEETVSGGLL